MAVNHLHAQATAVGVLVHEVNALHKGVVLDDGVGVEKQQALARAAGECLVVGAGEAHVLVVLDNVHVGEVLTHHLHASVDRVVVNHPHVECQLRAVGQPPLRPEH